MKLEIIVGVVIAALIIFFFLFLKQTPTPASTVKTAEKAKEKALSIGLVAG